MGVREEVLTRNKLVICLLVVGMIILFTPCGSTDNPHSLDVVEISEPQNQMVNAADPALLNFSSFLGGSGDEEYICSDNDAAGNIYIAGTTDSRDFPLVNPIDDVFEGHSPEGFLTKINPNGTIIYSTFIGGNGYDQINDIFVDDTGFVYLTGGTDSEDFPTVNAFDSTLNEGDCFVCKINQAGTGFIYSTFIGGSAGESGYAIDVNQYGEVYVGGQTGSSNFPTRDPFDSSFGGYREGFVLKLSSNGNNLIFSSLIGGRDLEDVTGISVDQDGYFYVTGTTWSNDFPIYNAMDQSFEGSYDGFVTKVNPSGTLNFSTFLGGIDVEHAEAIDSDSLGRAYVTGVTTSSNFPTTIRALKDSYSYTRDSVDGFLTVFNPEGSLNYSTFFGTSGSEWPEDVFVNGVGSVYVCGSSNMLVGLIKDSYDSSFNGGADAFVFRMNTDRGDVVIGSYLGGTLLDQATSISVDHRNTMYVCGWTWSENFPMRNPVDSTYNPGGYDGYDFFVTAITDSSDWDSDNILDTEEILLGTDSRNPDSDFDLLGDYLEVYQLGTNPLSNCTFGNGTLDGDLDHDGDMLTNVEELYEYGTDLLNPDSDLDFLEDGFEVHVVGSLPTEFDSDFDLLSDWEEYMVYSTNCTSADSDSDSMLDYYEVHNGLNPLVDDATDDEDSDTLSNLLEFTIGSSANNTDSDFDSMPDSWEYAHGLDPVYDDSLLDIDEDSLSNLDEFLHECDPWNSDCDRDTLLDGFEVLVLGTNPLSGDSDMDSMPDQWEVEYGLNPLVDDSLLDLDGDSLSNLEEYEAGIRPDMADTDQDSYSDDWELYNGFDPNNPNIHIMQIVYGNLSMAIIAVVLPVVALSTVYIAWQQKQKTKNEEYRELIDIEMEELLDSIDTELASDG